MRDVAGKTREASITRSFANFIDTNGTVVQTLVITEVTKLYNSLASEKKDKWLCYRLSMHKWLQCSYSKLKVLINLSVYI